MGDTTTAAAPYPDPSDRRTLMTKLDDLLDIADLAAAIQGGYVRSQTHPTLPLFIYNYTEKAAYEGVWTPVTRQCRGLIVHAVTGEVLARPFPKFMNHGQDGAHVGTAGDRVVDPDKQDGSLGILYPTGNGGHAVATRGSFASDQALHATEVWQQRYAGTARPERGWTYLFEIIYPANRIVVDYQGMDDLVLLGAVHIETGRSLPPAVLDEWPGPRTQTFPYNTLAEALAAPDRPGREGLVVHYVAADERIKLKQADYVALHKIVTGLNARVVWEQLGAGKTIVDVCDGLPDEFHGWVAEVAVTLRRQAAGLVGMAQAMHGSIISNLPEGWTRRDYAGIAKQSKVSPYLFWLLDGRDVAPLAWKDVRPAADWTPSGRPATDEDAAA